MKSIIRITLLLFLYSSCNEPQTGSMESRTLSEDLVPEFKNKKAEEYYIKGNNARDDNNPEKAKKYFQKSHELDSTHVLNLNNLGNICITLKQYEEAESTFKKAMRIDPLYGGTYINYTNLTINRKEFEKGIEIGKLGLSRINENTKHSTLIHLNLSILYKENKNCPLSLKELKLAEENKEFIPLKVFNGIKDEIYQACPN